MAHIFINPKKILTMLSDNRFDKTNKILQWLIIMVKNDKKKQIMHHFNNSECYKV